MIVALRRWLVYRAPRWLVRVHHYVTPAAGYSGWVTAPLLGVVGFISSDDPSDVTVRW